MLYKPLYLLIIVRCRRFSLNNCSRCVLRRSCNVLRYPCIRYLLSQRN
jgi:hypothetical protein